MLLRLLLLLLLLLLFEKKSIQFFSENHKLIHKYEIFLRHDFA